MYLWYKPQSRYSQYMCTLHISVLVRYFYFFLSTAVNCVVAWFFSHFWQQWQVLRMVSSRLGSVRWDEVRILTYMVLGRGTWWVSCGSREDGWQADSKMCIVLLCITYRLIAGKGHGLDVTSGNNCKPKSVGRLLATFMIGVVLSQHTGKLQNIMKVWMLNVETL
jgi:hypothetical protein